jgi:hypothetical protein
MFCLLHDEARCDFSEFVMPEDVNGDKRDCKFVTKSCSTFESTLFCWFSGTDSGALTYAGDEKLLKILCGFTSSAILDFISTGVSDNERDANLLLVIVALFLWDRWQESIHLLFSFNLWYVTMVRLLLYSIKFWILGNVPESILISKLVSQYFWIVLISNYVLSYMTRRNGTNWIWVWKKYLDILENYLPMFHVLLVFLCSHLEIFRSSVWILKVVTSLYLIQLNKRCTAASVYSNASPSQHS